ncbi:MAG TPA: hypothetical protein VFD13_02770 [Candidatus Kapabacteria bacterium]|nr:hypothetical protein [Candidatus Kapabacteria bacterium]
MLALPSVSNAQYFISEHLDRQVLKAGKYDSVIVLSATPFAVPPINDTTPLVYHEPMPDSIMPRSAIVIGTISVQAENADDVVPMIEKYARKLGADWLVSFQEPRPTITKSGWKVYRSKALLLRVLDDQFVNQANLEYTYDEQVHLQNYAAVNNWYDQYGRHLGAKLDQPEQPGPSEMDELNPDRQIVK